MAVDAVLDKKKGYYDFSLDDEGQIIVDDFFDTALLYSILGEQRATAAEVSEPSARRGWIGNEGTGYENGSKVWLQSQARLTLNTLTTIEAAVANSLRWLVKDNLAISVDLPVVEASDTSVSITVTIRRSVAQVIQRTYELWNRTGLK